MSKFRTYCGLPAESVRVGRRVRLAYGDKAHGTVQSVDQETGMAWIWWDGRPCPGHGITEATNIGNIVLEVLA